MWPRLEEWRRWSALDKASYVAQLLAPVALVVSSVFSFLSWQEARQALEIQQRMFATQNGPLLELVGSAKHGKKSPLVGTGPNGTLGCCIM